MSTINVGKNATDNWKLLDSTNGIDSHVFHLAHYPSSYVILRTEEDPTFAELHEAAVKCKQSTKQRNIPNISVNYSKRSNVFKGKNLGEMIWKSNRNVKTIVV
jgi:predicted ribosome quality control (RQC) complex YloA/Tae2 family protein